MDKVQGFNWTIRDNALISPHDVYGDVLVQAGTENQRLVCLSADLAETSKIGMFKQAFPQRFFNVGVAEQNLIAVAAGLAATGLIPVVTTYATFASLRAAEFIRTDLAYNQRPVIILGTYSGVTAGAGGPTHQSLEDFALLRAIPGMVVIATCDGHQTAQALLAAIDAQQPVYIRSGRGSETLVYDKLVYDKLEYDKPDTPFTIGKANTLNNGQDLTVIACGVTLYPALCAAHQAEKEGISVRVLDMHTIKPLDEAAVISAIRETGRIITVEDHSVINGLGSAVSDVITSNGLSCQLYKIGHADCFAGMGIPEDLLAQAGMDETGIRNAIRSLMESELGTRVDSKLNTGAQTHTHRDDDWSDEY